jgi:alpha-glucosidase
VIRSIPSVWDETVALPCCAVGELSAFARRRGSVWFLAVLNGPTARSLKVPLSFLGPGDYQGLEVRDRADEAAAVRVGTTKARRGDTLTIDLRSGGGFVARFARAAK